LSDAQGEGGGAPSAPDEAVDATRRTHLANERTRLAWWRTGLTALAVALAVGRVLPDLRHAGNTWPYTVIGVGFGIYGVALIAYGSRRATAVAQAVQRGGLELPPDQLIGVLSVTGIALGLAISALLVFD
jgi:putative membrane protein